jgi:hypothetical protein
MSLCSPVSHQPPLAGRAALRARGHMPIFSIRPRQAASVERAGPLSGFGPLAKDLIKSFIFFQIRFNSIPTLKIHIFLFRAPKIMKPVLLDL